MLAGRPDLRVRRLREQGYRRRWRAAGVPVDPTLVLVGDYDPATSAEAARRLLTAPSRPTAVFAANDMSAIATIGAPPTSGLRGARRPVGGRLRQHPRVGADRARR